MYELGPDSMMTIDVVRRLVPDHLSQASAFRMGDDIYDLKSFYSYYQEIMIIPDAAECKKFVYGIPGMHRHR